MLVEVMMGARSLDRSKSLIRWPTSKSLFCCADIKHERKRINFVCVCVKNSELGLATVC